jgi:serine phosphatase RsbU (regulator of sigma subunit)
VKKLKININIVISIVILALFLVLFSIFANRIEEEFRVNRNFVEHIFVLQQQSQELETQFLQANFFLYHNYDKIQELMRDIKSEIREIQKNRRLLSDEFSEIKDLILKVEKQFHHKEELFQEFLTVNSTIKNVTNYIPHISIKLFEAIDADKVKRNRDIFSTITTISSSLLLAKNSLDSDFISSFKEYREDLASYNFRTEEMKHYQHIFLLNLDTVIAEFPHYVSLLHQIREVQNIETIKIAKNRFFQASIDNMQSRIWWLLVAFNITFFIVVTVIIYLLLRIDRENRNLKKLHHDIEKLNESLEEQVENRTRKLKSINMQLTDSMRYASLIQKAIIPDQTLLPNSVKDSFIIWQPRDIVGGDIYLIEKIDNNMSLIMVIDGTGHGVPGAFVTMLVKAIERQVIVYLESLDRDKISPAKILSFFNKSIKRVLKQNGKESKSNVGFDGAIMLLDTEENRLLFAGASTALFFNRSNSTEIEVVKGDRKSIGYRDSDENFKFKETLIELKEGMNFYITTDGYIDQIGGHKGFPFGKKRFKKIITECNDMPFVRQREVLLREFHNYRGQNQQIDDITVLGFRV